MSPLDEGNSLGVVGLVDLLEDAMVVAVGIQIEVDRIPKHLLFEKLVKGGGVTGTSDASFLDDIHVGKGGGVLLVDVLEGRLHVTHDLDVGMYAEVVVVVRAQDLLASGIDEDDVEVG